MEHNRRRRLFESNILRNKIDNIKTAKAKRAERIDRHEVEEDEKKKRDADRLVRLACLKLDKIDKILRDVATEAAEAEEITGKPLTVGDEDFSTGMDVAFGPAEEGYFAVVRHVEDSGYVIEARVHTVLNEIEVRGYDEDDIRYHYFEYDPKEPNLDSMTNFVCNVYECDEDDDYEGFSALNYDLVKILENAKKLEKEAEKYIGDVLDDYEQKEIRGSK